MFEGALGDIFGRVNTDFEPTLKKTSMPTGGLALAARTLVSERVRGLGKFVQRRLDPGDLIIRPASDDTREHLFQQACELYWNELGWEELVEEERFGDEGLTEMIFPGLLAFINALLPRAQNGEPDRDRERRDVAHDFVEWLAARVISLREGGGGLGDERERLAFQRTITDDLIDLVIYRICSLSHDEMTAHQGA